jgi:dienelactone hydrolase
VKLRVTTPGFAPHTAQVIHYRPASPEPAPAVVFSPILGRRAALNDWIATALARRGVHVALVLPSLALLDAEAPPDALEAAFRTALVDRRRAVDWLLERDDVDPERLGALGISLGGVLTTALLACEPRVRRGVVALAGAELDAVLLGSDEPRVAAWVSSQTDGRGLSQATLRDAIRSALPSLGELAESVDARRVLFVEARRDTTVPTPCQRALWTSLGRPAKVSLPTGHYTSAVYAPYVLDLAAEHLAGRR